jgi:hypothetical protein
MKGRGNKMKMDGENGYLGKKEEEGKWEEALNGRGK